MFKRYFETGDAVEYAAPGKFPITGIVTDVDRYITDYDTITIACAGLPVDGISLVVSEYYCVKREE